MPAPETFTLARPDGVTLQGLCWRPANAGAASRTVVLVHGLGEHVGRYAALADWFGARGWTVRGHDHRGHGRSQGARGTLRNSLDLVDDLAAALDALDALAPGAGAPPPLLMGQSMGGLVALTYALRHPGRIAGLVLISPALAPGLSLFQKVLLAVMSRLAPDVAVANGLDPAKLSHDAAVVRAYVDDPLVHDRVSARLARFIVDGSRDALARASALSVPTLLMFGGDDRIVDPDGSREFARRAPHSLLVAREYPALWHEILNETPAERSAVLADLDAWLAQR